MTESNCWEYPSIQYYPHSLSYRSTLRFLKQWNVSYHKKSSTEVAMAKNLRSPTKIFSVVARFIGMIKIILLPAISEIIPSKTRWKAKVTLVHYFNQRSYSVWQKWSFSFGWDDRNQRAYLAICWAMLELRWIALEIVI